MIYCMSDIHGEVDRFNEMLKLINFSDADTLYIIGDVADRYPGGVELWKKIMQTSNMVMIKGNHEDMCIKTLGARYEYGARSLWRENGGSSTYREMMYITAPDQRNKIVRWLEQLPTYLDIVVGNRKFRLVHGWPGETEEEFLWGRPMDFSPMWLPEDMTAIIGHTPTCYLAGDAGEPFRIYHGERFIDIDCGCGNETQKRRLACLRLDDMKEFYV